MVWLAFDNLFGDKTDLGFGIGFWIIGDVFLRNVYSAWDVDNGGRIGFADLA